MDGEARLAEAQVDFNKGSGYFIRLDVEVESLDGAALGPGHLGWLRLSHETAERLGQDLLRSARKAKTLRVERTASHRVGPGEDT